MKKIILTLSLCVLLMSGCTSTSVINLSNTTGSLLLSEQSSLNPQVVDQINALAFLLQDNQSKDNTFISSLSIYLALAMTSHGTAGLSYDQFKALLNPNNLEETEWLDQLKALQGNLNAASPIKIALSNSIWIRDNFADQVKQDFLDRNKAYFGAFIAALDFSQSHATDEINAWVKKKTNKLIDKVIETIDPATVMMLINTIYFKGNWVSPFKESETFNRIFHGTSDQEVKFMSQTGSFLYREHKERQTILMPYEGGKMGMMIVMDKNSASPIISTQQFKEELASLVNASVTLHLPKVDIATSLQLNEPLIALGLSAPFEPGVADFSRLASADLYISKVLHKSRLLIDEKGTEAAAATTVIIDKTSIEIGDFEMRVDQPFQVFIVDLENQFILFSGSIHKVND